MVWGCNGFLSFVLLCTALWALFYLFIYVIYINKEEKKSHKVWSFSAAWWRGYCVLAFQAWTFLLENPQPNGSMVSCPTFPTKLIYMLICPLQKEFPFSLVFSIYYCFFLTIYSNASQCQAAMCHIYMHRISLIKALFGCFSIILFMGLLTFVSIYVFWGAGNMEYRMFSCKSKTNIIFSFSCRLKSSFLFFLSFFFLSICLILLWLCKIPNKDIRSKIIFQRAFLTFFRRSWYHVRVAENYLNIILIQ